MQKFVITAFYLTVILVLVCSAANADINYFSIDNNGQYDVGPGYAFAYSSFAQSPGTDDLTGITYTEWFYDYYFANLSTDHTIVSWTCDVPLVNDQLANMMMLGPTDGETLQQDEVSFNHPDGVGVVNSVITWEDGFQSIVPVYAVPEPSSIIAFATALVGLLGLYKRRSS